MQNSNFPFKIIRQTTGTRLECLCPKCSHKALVFNLDSGLFHCFQCYFKGLLDEFKIPNFTPRPFEKQAAHIVTKAILNLGELADHHVQYLTQRGVINPDKLQIKSVDFTLISRLVATVPQETLAYSGYFISDSNRLRPGISLRSGRILIPYVNNSKVLGFKSRVNPDDELLDEQKYTSPYGSNLGSSLYYQKLAPTMAITEGELGAIIATQNGLPTFSVSGISCTHRILPELKRLVNTKKINRLFVVYDNSSTPEGREVVDKAVSLILTELPKQAVKITLPLQGKDKMDLDSFILNYGMHELDYLLETAWIKKIRS